MVELRIQGENLDELLAKVFGLRAKNQAGLDITQDKDLTVIEDAPTEGFLSDPPAPEAPVKEEKKPEVKIETVRAAGKAYIEKNGRDAFGEILNKFGCKRLTDVPADKLGELMALLEG